MFKAESFKQIQLRSAIITPIQTVTVQEHFLNLFDGFNCKNVHQHASSYICHESLQSSIVKLSSDDLNFFQISALLCWVSMGICKGQMGFRMNNFIISSCVVFYSARQPMVCLRCFTTESLACHFFSLSFVTSYITWLRLTNRSTKSFPYTAFKMTKQKRIKKNYYHFFIIEALQQPGISM